MFRQLVVVLAVLGVHASAFGQELDAWKQKASPEECELVDLLDALSKEYQAHYAEAERISDWKKQWEFYRQSSPAGRFVPKLLEFEKRHQGSEVGLMALRQVVFLAGGGLVGKPQELGRREALKRLPAYANRPVLAEVLRYLNGGHFELESEGLLRSLAHDSAADPTVRVFSRLMLADVMLSARNGRSSKDRLIRELDEGAPPRYPAERLSLEESLKLYPPASELQRSAKEATVLLRELCSSKTAQRQPAVRPVDPKGYIIRVDEKRTEQMPLISSLAEGMLFKETHLREGKRAPELNVKLISGQDWSLAAQAGRVTVIQFSFKGCGPCEAMYPDLREIQRAYGDRVSILSIMADERIEDTREAVSSGKMTWNVHWDGFRGPLATRWAVDSFPAVYVVDGHGLVAARGGAARGERLKNVVASLLK